MMGQKQGAHWCSHHNLRAGLQGGGLDLHGQAPHHQGRPDVR